MNIEMVSERRAVIIRDALRMAWRRKADKRPTIQLHP
jgi:hypothetical protein